MWYGPSQLGCSFPCCASITTSFKTRLPSRISLNLTFKLYLIATLCLETNSQTWVTSLISSTMFTTHFKLILFAYLLNWDRRCEGGCQLHLSFRRSKVTSTGEASDDGMYVVGCDLVDQIREKMDKIRVKVWPKLVLSGVHSGCHCNLVKKYKCVCSPHARRLRGRSRFITCFGGEGVVGQSMTLTFSLPQKRLIPCFPRRAKEEYGVRRYLPQSDLSLSSLLGRSKGIALGDVFY